MNVAARAFNSSMRIIVLAAVLAASHTAAADPPKDFIDDAKLLYRIAACGSEDAVKPDLQKIVDHHCKVVHATMDKFRALYLGTRGRAW
jgi:hypothetical protein